MIDKEHRDENLKKILKKTIESPTKDFTSNVMNLIAQEASISNAEAPIMKVKNTNYFSLNNILLVTVFLLAIGNILSFAELKSPINIFQSIAEQYNIHFVVTNSQIMIVSLVSLLGWGIYFLDKTIKQIFKTDIS